MAVIEFHRMAERYISFVGGIKNRRGFAATVLLVSANYGLNKTNVFLIAPSYKKTPHECKGLQSCFGRGFFEGSNGVYNLFFIFLIKSKTHIYL